MQQIAKRLLCFTLAVSAAAALTACSVTPPPVQQLDPVEVMPTQETPPPETAEPAETAETVPQAEPEAGTQTGTTASEQATDSQPEPPTEEACIQQARDILTALNKAPGAGETPTVTRQNDTTWSREEILVAFGDREVSFDGGTGALIGVRAFDNTSDDTAAPMEESAALAVAQAFYEALPYPTGYSYSNLDRFDDHAWTFSFSRSYTVELDGVQTAVFNPYEQVRIVIDPCTGLFQLSNAFCRPVAENAAEGRTPLTQADAQAIAEESTTFAQDRSAYTLTAALGCCLPFQDGGSYAGAARLCWSFQYDGEIDGVADCYWIDVDLYTGEVLSVLLT